MSANLKSHLCFAGKSQELRPRLLLSSCSEWQKKLQLFLLFKTGCSSCWWYMFKLSAHWYIQALKINLEMKILFWIMSYTHSLIKTLLLIIMIKNITRPLYFSRHNRSPCFHFFFRISSLPLNEYESSCLYPNQLTLKNDEQSRNSMPVHQTTIHCLQDF